MKISVDMEEVQQIEESLDKAKMQIDQLEGNNIKRDNETKTNGNDEAQSINTEFQDIMQEFENALGNDIIHLKEISKTLEEADHQVKAKLNEICKD